MHETGRKMSTLRILAMALAIIAISGCKPSPPASPAGDATADTPAREEVTFRARVEFPDDYPLPEGAELVVYLVAGNIDTGEMEVIAQVSVPVPAESPAMVELNVPLDTIRLDTAYEISAAMADAGGQVFMNTLRNRPPAPAMALQWESVFNIRLMPRATPVDKALIFRLPGPLSFDCGDMLIDVEQEDDGLVVVSMPGEELRLPPAAATAGGRFSGATHELWITESGQAFLLSLTGVDRECSPR